MTSRTFREGTTNFTYTGNEMTAAGSSSLLYDENGNMTSAPKSASTSMSLEYNWDNKLRNATVSSDEISIKYDPAGNRVYKNSVNSVSSVARKYIVDVAGSTGSPQVGDLPVILIELNADDADYAVVMTYIYANAEILSEHDGGSTASQYYYLHDRLGSVREVITSVDSVISVAKTLTYNPFGETIEEQGTFYTPWKFTGQYLDSETGQYYLRARQYSPYLSRFTSYDPVMGEFQNPLSLHKYLYCQNDPIDGIDLDGRKVYWATRQVNGRPFFNHSFVLCEPDNAHSFERQITILNQISRALTGTNIVPENLMRDLGNGRRGFTLTGTEGETGSETGKLIASINGGADIGAAQMFSGVSGRLTMGEGNNRVQANLVGAPRGQSDMEFIWTLLNQTFNYKHNTASSPINYFPGPAGIANNCNVWVNSMFHAAGVSDATRAAASDFAFPTVGTKLGRISDWYFQSHEDEDDTGWIF